MLSTHNSLFCRDGSFLLTGSGDSTARVFTVQTPGRWQKLASSQRSCKIKLSPIKTY